MKGWLKGWGKSESGGAMGGMDHGSGSGMGMPGMMSDGEMSTLGKTTRAAFDQMFLAMMIAHHTGAIEVAKTEQSTGRAFHARPVRLFSE